MSQSTVCRLCVQVCLDFKSLYSANGRANELHELALEYFHPKIVDMEAAKHLSAVCVECARHIYDFHQFQASITRAQLNLTEAHQIVRVKMEHEEGISGNFQHHEAVLPDSNVKVEEEFIPLSGEEISTGDGQMATNIKVESSMDSSGAVVGVPPNCITKPELEVGVAVPPDFTIKPELEIIDMPEQSEWSSEDEDNDDNSPTDATEKRFKHTCTICGNSFMRTFNYVAHMRWQHETEGAPCTSKGRKRLRYKCDLCTNSFASRKNLKGHLKHQHGIEVAATDIDCDMDFDETTKRLSCKICGKCYLLRIHMIQHMEKLHPEVRQMRHNSTGHGPSETVHACEVFKCKFCNHAGMLKGAVRTHMEQQHGVTWHKFEFDYEEDTKLFKCKLCQASYSYERSLKKHMEQTHWEQDDLSLKLEYNYDVTTASLRCQLCNSSQTNIHSLVTHVTRQHWQTTQVTQNQCQICKQNFLTKLALAQHYTEVHCPAGLYPCNECGKAFTEESNLNKHRRNVHSTRPKLHKCETCGKFFRTAPLLRKHLQSHSQNRTYSCAFCPSKFKYARNVGRHIKLTHSQEINSYGN